MKIFLLQVSTLLASVNGFQPVAFRTGTPTTTRLYSEEIKDYRRGLNIVDQKNVTSASQRVDPIDCVFKFGGSSLANAERIDHVAHLIKDQIKLGIHPRAVVCSAMGKSTNNLLSAGEFALAGKVNLDAVKTLATDTCQTFQFPNHVVTEVLELLEECEQMLTGISLLQELSPKSLDQLVSYGERCSVRMMAARLNQIGVPSLALDAWDVGIHTDSIFGDACLLETSEKAIQTAFERIDTNIVAVVTGFIGKDKEGRITTLGRGGSDLTATALGASLKLDEVVCWKDVDGILTSDPRVTPLAITVDQVTFEEASELAYFGASVLHPIAMQPCMKHNVPVRVKNSYNPAAVGTIIQKETSPDIDRLVTAITYKRDITVLDIHSTMMLGSYGFLSRVFAEFEKHKLSVDVLASSEVSVSLTMDKKQESNEISRLIKNLQDCAEITRKDDKSILTLIADVQRSSHVLATVFRVFSTQEIPVEMMSQGASKVNISFVVNTKDLDRAIMHLHNCFFEDECIVEQFRPDEKEESAPVDHLEGQEIDNLLNTIQNEIASSESKDQANSKSEQTA